MRKLRIILFIVLFYSFFFAFFAGSTKERKEEKTATEEAPLEEKVETPEGVAEEKPTAIQQIQIPPELSFNEKAEEEKKLGKITGRVIDESGNPVSGAYVYLYDQNGKQIATVKTDEKGQYVFKDLEEGEYRIKIEYPGFSAPVEIPIKRKEVTRRAPIPTGLRLEEIPTGIGEPSIVRATWDRMEGVTGYKAQILLRGERTPLFEYPDIVSNYCEFGNLEENTEYQVRVFSKNESGYSISYALRFIKTINKPPLPPHSLVVLDAKNNRVELAWGESNSKDLMGYLIQVKKDGGKYLYFTGSGLSSEVKDALIIKNRPDEYGLIGFSIDGFGNNRKPIIENLIPYSFRVFSIDKGRNISKPSNTVEEIVLKDTVPPKPPTNIKYQFIKDNVVRITWDSPDTDVAKFRVYYGTELGRWDGVIYTGEKNCELRIEKELLEEGSLYIVVNAIDKAGNESGVKPVVKQTTVLDAEEVEENIVITDEDIYKDYAVAIKKVEKKPPQKVVKKKKIIKRPPPPKKYGFDYLARKGYRIKSGETAIVSGKHKIPQDIFIIVDNGGTLFLDEAELIPERRVWGGIRYLNGSKGSIDSSIVRGALNGIAASGVGELIVKNTGVYECKDKGIYIKNGKAELLNVDVESNGTGVLAENAKIVIIDSVFKNNNKGFLSFGYDARISGSIFERNKQYGIRVYGKAVIANCIARNNLVGMVFEKGKGKASLVQSTVSSNEIDGLVVSTSELEIKYCNISNNGRNGIYVKGNEEPLITQSDIISNGEYGVIGGGRVIECFVAYNNGSPYIDDTGTKGTPDNVNTSSSSGMIKQIYLVDFIDRLLSSSAVK